MEDLEKNPGVKSFFLSVAASVLHQCLHMMHLGTGLRIGHQRFGSAYSSIQNHTGDMRVKHLRVLLKAQRGRKRDVSGGEM